MCHILLFECRIFFNTIRVSNSLNPDVRPEVKSQFHLAPTFSSWLKCWLQQILSQGKPCILKQNSPRADCSSFRSSLIRNYMFANCFLQKVFKLTHKILVLIQLVSSKSSEEPSHSASPEPCLLAYTKYRSREWLRLLDTSAWAS